MKRNRFWVLILLAAAIQTGCGAPQRQPSDVPPPVSLKAPPAEAEALARKAEQEQKAGKIPAAITLWERIVQTYPNTKLAPKGLYTVGAIYLEQKQAERALGYFDYLIFTYPGWEGINLAKLGQLSANRMTGKKRVEKDGLALWQAASGQPEVQVGLSRLMADVYKSQKDLETAFEWLWAGFNATKAPEDQKILAKQTIDLLNDADENATRKLFKKNPPEFMRVFLDYRLGQLEMQKGQADAARERFRTLLVQNPLHPLVPEIQSALRGAPAGVAAKTDLPLNANRVGCLIPLSGQYEKYGRLVLRGLGLAMEDWSKKHGGKQVTLAVKDAQAESEAAIKGFEQLAREEGVIAVIGPLGTQGAKAVSPHANKWGVPLLTLTQKDDEPSDNAFVVHVFLDNRELVRSLVHYCREKLGFTRFASLYPDDRYGQRLSKIFAEVVKEEGGELLASVPYKEKSTDFKDPIEKLMKVAKQNIPPTGVEVTPFEGLFVPDQVQTVSLLAPQLPYYNVVGATLLGTNLWGEAPLADAGGAYVEQALFATPFSAESDSQRVKAFRERYQENYSEAPSYLEAQAYDAMMLFLEAHSGLRGAAADRASLMRNLLQIHDYQGVTGTYSFSPEGDLKRDYLVFQVLNGQLVQVSP